VACQTPLPSDSSSVSQRLTGFVPCAGVGQRVAECPTPLPLRDKSQSVRAQCNKAPRLPPLIFSGGINKRTRGASQGSTHGAFNANWCWQRKHSRRPRQQLRCLPREHWITGLILAKETFKVLPKTAVAVPPKRALEHWTGAGKGSTQGASQDNRCGASQESTGPKEISPVGETQAGRARGAS